MKKSFLLACICIVGYMFLTSLMVTKITSRQEKQNIENNNHGKNFEVLQAKGLLKINFIDSKRFSEMSITNEKGQKLYFSKQFDDNTKIDTQNYKKGIYSFNLLTIEGDKVIKKIQIN